MVTPLAQGNVARNWQSQAVPGLLLQTLPLGIRHKYWQVKHKEPEHKTVSLRPAAASGQILQ